MRAPRFARMAAVAAPKPDAEPVTIAHKPSFDIRISSCCFDQNFSRGGIPYRAIKSLQIGGPSARRNSFIAGRGLMLPPQAALRAALVRAMAFPHHKAQEKSAPEARRNNGLSANKLYQSRRGRRGGE